MRRLAVDFPAALHVTHVLLLFRRVIVVPVITSADLHLEPRVTNHSKLSSGINQSTGLSVKTLSADVSPHFIYFTQQGEEHLTG